jgi:hypothetical protein
MREAYDVSIPMPRHTRHGIYAEAIETGIEAPARRR